MESGCFQVARLHIDRADGTCNAWQTARTGALRKLREESGYKLKELSLVNRNDAHLKTYYGSTYQPEGPRPAYIFRADVDFAKIKAKRGGVEVTGHDARTVIFSRCKKGKTIDHGFAALVGNHVEVQKYGGTPKATQVLRGGSYDPIKKELSSWLSLVAALCIGVLVVAVSWSRIIQRWQA